MATKDPIHTREDLARYVLASELVQELVTKELMRMSGEQIKHRMTHEEGNKRAALLGIITAAVAFTTADVRRYVEEHNS
jgi:hypothetical protein